MLRHCYKNGNDRFSCSDCNDFNDFIVCVIVALDVPVINMFSFCGLLFMNINEGGIKLI